MSNKNEKILLRSPFFKIYLDTLIDKHYENDVYKSVFSFSGTSLKITLHVQKYITKDNENQIQRLCKNAFRQYYYNDNNEESSPDNLKVVFEYSRQQFKYAKEVFLYVKNAFFKRNRGIFNIDLPQLPTTILGCILRIKGKAGVRKRSKTLTYGKVLLGTKSIKRDLHTNTITSKVGSYGVKTIIFYKDVKVGPALI